MTKGIFMQLVDRRLRLALFCILLGIYLFAYIDEPDSADGQALLAVSASLVRYGSPDMNSIAFTDWILPPRAGMGRTGIDGATYAKKGITPSLALIPLVMTAEVIPWLTTQATTMFLNPLLTAGTSVVLYTLIRRMGYRPRTAFVSSLLYGVSTLAFVYTKTLFGEPLAALLILIAVLNTYDYRQSGKIRNAVVIGVCIGLLIGVNTVYTSLVPYTGIVAFAGIGVFQKNHRRKMAGILAYLAPIFVCLMLLGLFNLARFGSLTEVGYRFSEGEGFIHPITTGLYGLFLSPYRGLFWYSPLLLLAIPGAVMLLKDKKSRVFTLLLLGIILAQAVMFAGWWSWHGGVVWGTRFLIPIIPLMVVLIAPLVESAWKKPVFAASIGFLAVVSIGVQLLGVLYSYLPHHAYLVNHFYTGDFYAPVTYLDNRIFYETDYSPILGHLALAVSGWSVEPVALNELDWIHIGAAVAVIGVGSGILMLRWAGVAVAGIVVVVALNVIGARRSQTADVQRVLALGDTLQPRAALLAATTGYGARLVDIEGRNRVITINAPTSQDDALARTLVDYTKRHDDQVWYLTWHPPANDENWVERELWDTASFAHERNIDGHRALLFDVSPPAPLDQSGGFQFGGITLGRYGYEVRSNGIYVSLEWAAGASLEQDYAWFVHLLDEQTNIVAQQDRQPLGGYAPTSRWSDEDAPIVDRLYFPMEGNQAEVSAIRIGWVDPTTHERLGTAAAEGNELPDNFVVIGVEQ
jgi:hypothetical protein